MAEGQSTASQQHVGEDETDSYEHSSGTMYLMQEFDYTGTPTGKYCIQVKPHVKPKTPNGTLSEVTNEHVEDRCKAEYELRKKFGYPDHKTKEKPTLFEPDLAKEDVMREFLEILQTKNEK